MKKNDVFHSHGWKGRLLSLVARKLIFILTFFFSVSVYSMGYGQAGNITLEVKNQSVEEIVKQIRETTGYRFLFNHEDLKTVGSKSCNFQNSTINQVMDELLAGSGLTYEVREDIIVIVPAKAQEPEKKTITVTGVVRNANGEPLPGVTVMLETVYMGVSTDEKGRYSFTFPAFENPVIVFGFVGMKTQKVKYTGKNEINVTMYDDVTEIDEVVVTGYRTVKRSNMAGAISTVKAKDLVLDGSQTLEQALQGKLPGVVVTNQSGLIGTRQKTRVRGTSTLLGNQEPVWVVDGIIQEDPLPFKATELTGFGRDPDNIDVVRNFVGSAIAWLNPSDIDEVTVLKDASATAIYGVKAANGVIIITTKRGEAGRMSVNYSGQFSTGSKLSYDKMHLMNSKERVDVSREIYERGLVSATGLDPVGYQGLLKHYLEEKISYSQFNSGVKQLETNNTDWFDILYKNPFSHSHSLSISGGDQKSNYYASFGMSDRDGTARGNNSTTYQGSVSANSVFWDKLTIGGRLAGSVTKTDGFNKVDPYKYASETSRVIPCLDEEGNLLYYTNRNNYQYNVLNELANTGNSNSTSSLNAAIDLRWKIGMGFTFESKLGYNYSSSYGEAYATERSNYMAEKRTYEFGEFGPTDAKYRQSPVPRGGELTIVENRNNNYTWRNSLQFVRTFDKHLVTAMVGQEVRSNKYDGLNEVTYGYMPDRGKTLALPPVTVENEAGALIANRIYNQMYTRITDRKSNYLSFYADMSYTYDERYVLTASLRTDASNRFGQDKSARYQPVWSVGLRWNAAREKWFDNQDIVNDLSIRASYGFQGNVAENVSPDMIAYIPSGSQAYDPLTGEYVLKITSLPAPNLTWEKNQSLNLGLDFSFFHNKVFATIEYYYKHGKDIIVNREVPYENGIVSMPMNGGTMVNQGWELSMNFVPLRLKNFVWSLGFNMSQNYNKLNSSLEANTTYNKAISGTLYKKGYPVSAFWAFRFMGLDPENGSPLLDLSGAENNPLAETDATEYMRYMGKMDPDFTGGINTSFRYKSLTLSASFNMSVGGKKFLAPMFQAGSVNNTPREYTNLTKDLVRRWRKPGDEAFTDIPGLDWYHKNDAIVFPGRGTNAQVAELYNFSDARVVRASFLRCQSISLSYTLPNKLISSFAQNIGVSANVTNPFIIVSKDYKGIDPEVAMGQQPITKTFTLSLNVSF